MKIELRVHHPGADRTATGGLVEVTTDVAVEVSPTDTVYGLSVLLAEHLRFRLGADSGLWHERTGAVLAPEAEIGSTGLLSGDTVAVGLARRSIAPMLGDDHLRLVVGSGPDAGTVHVLRPGTHTIGRADDCGLVLTDPQISRHDCSIDVRAAINAPDRPTVTIDPGEERTNALRLNGAALHVSSPLRADDQIRIGATTLHVRAPQHDPIVGTGSTGTVPFERTPDFRRPIVGRRLPALGRLPVRPEPRRLQFLAVLAPLVMGIAMAYLFDSPRYLLFACMSPVIMLGTWIDARRHGGRDYKRRIAELRERMAVRELELADALDAERQLRLANSPSAEELARRARSHDKRLWNRQRTSAGFLDLRLGLATVDAAIDHDAETQGDDEFRAEVAAMIERYRRVVDVPVTVNLVDHPVLALVGAASETVSLAAGLAVQAAALHSPEDLVIASVVPDATGFNERLKWLPHVRSQSSPVAGPHAAGDVAAGQALVQTVANLAEERSRHHDRNLDLRWPRILLFVDRSLEPDPGTVARLLDHAEAAGVSVVWLASDDGLVPRQAGVVARINAPRSGLPSQLRPVDHELHDQEFEPERIGVEAAETAAMALAPLLDASAATAAASIPGLVTLFDALGVDTVTPEWVAERWLSPRGHSLPAPVGMTDVGPLTLDLVRHGPHGLIGGTSGAGKSELVQSLVATLIALNSPEEVNLLFIDYKGGALSGLFADVPHSVGAVTNLDALLSLRALTSLKAELDRRMALFEAMKVKDIAEMLERHPEEAPPSLVIVVDEFASLVRELPEFVDGIVSIAERGRSLGIHLLLSTQRPSGSINENIQQNTNLRLALRMLDGGESNNVIGTSDAATIPQHLKGRGFARLGPGQLIAFQAAWSGAPSTGDGGPRPMVATSFSTGADDRPPTMMTTAGVAPVADVSSSATQLDVLLDAVVGAAHRLRMEPGRAPWRETLPGMIPLSAVLDDPRATNDDASTLTVGMIDNPEAQDQYPATFDLAEGGGLAVYGSGGSGRTTALVTAACSAAIADSRQGGGGLTIFGLDFGSRQLGVIGRLPQCETVAAGDDLEAVTRAVAVLGSVFERRQREAAAAVARAEDAPPFDTVLLLIDGYDNLADTFLGMGSVTVMQPWFDQINRLITQGRQVGIHSVIATGAMTGPSNRLANTIANRITLRQTDDLAYRSFGVPAAAAAGLELSPGQALDRTGRMVQLAVVGARPGPDGEPEIDPNAVVDLAEGLVGSPSPECATEPLPSLLHAPAPSAFDRVDEYIGATSDPNGADGTAGRPGLVELGIADLTLAPVSVDVAVNGLCVVGPPRSGRSTTLLTVAASLLDTGAEVWALGSAGSPLADVVGWTAAGFGRAGDIGPVLADMAAAVDADPVTPRYLLIDDADRFDDLSLNAPLKALVDAGVVCIGSAASTRALMGANPVHRELKNARNLLALAAEDEGAIQGAAGSRYHLRPGLEMAPGRGVLVAGGLACVVHVYADRGVDRGLTTTNNHQPKEKLT